MKKLVEHTFGTHIYMELELDNGELHKVDYYFHHGYKYEKYYTTADDDETKRIEIIKAFNALY